MDKLSITAIELLEIAEANQRVINRLKAIINAPERVSKATAAEQRTAKFFRIHKKT